MKRVPDRLLQCGDETGSRHAGAHLQNHRNATFACGQGSSGAALPAAWIRNVGEEIFAGWNSAFTLDQFHALEHAAAIARANLGYAEGADGKNQVSTELRVGRPRYRRSKTAPRKG